MIRASTDGPAKVVRLDRREYARLHKTLRHSEIVDLVLKREECVEPKETVVELPQQTNEPEPPQAALALSTLMHLYQHGQISKLTEYTNGQLHRQSLGVPPATFDKAQAVIRILYFAAHVVHNLPLPTVLPAKEGHLPITYGLHYTRERFTEDTLQQHVAKGGSSDSQWCYRHANGEIDPTLEDIHWKHNVYGKQLMPNGYVRSVIDRSYDRLMWNTLGGRYTDVFQYINLAGKQSPWLGMIPPDNPAGKGIYPDEEFARNANSHPEIFPLVLSSGAVRVDMAEVVRYGVSEIVSLWVEKGGSSSDMFIYVLPSGEIDVSFHLMLTRLQPYQRAVSPDVLADVDSFTEEDTLVKAGLATSVKPCINQYLQEDLCPTTS